MSSAVAPSLAARCDGRVDIRQVTTPDHIAATAALAHEIWNQHFPPIIGQAQVDYMLTTLQSAEAITQQIGDGGYDYYLVFENGEQAGYFALVTEPETPNALQLSKLYLKQSRRGRGLGRRLVAWIEAECARRGVEELWLTVNRDNESSIAFYERAGFTTVGWMVTDIGGGFVMDDYRMSRSLLAS